MYPKVGLVNLKWDESTTKGEGGKGVIFLLLALD